MRSAGGQGTHRNARRIEEMFEIPIGHIIKHKLLVPGATAYWPAKEIYSSGFDYLGWLAQDGYAELHFFRDGQRTAKPQRIEFCRSRFRNTLHHRVYFQGCATCKGRCGKLYIFEDETVAKCRLCHGALHATTGMKPAERAEYLAYKIRLRLDPNADWLTAEERAWAASRGIAVAPHVFPPRPKGMHWSTYNHLAYQHDQVLRGGGKMRHPRYTAPEPKPTDEEQQAEQLRREAAAEHRAEAIIAAQQKSAYAAVEQERETIRRRAVQASWPIDPRA